MWTKICYGPDGEKTQIIAGVPGLIVHLVVLQDVVLPGAGLGSARGCQGTCRHTACSST